MTISDKLIYLSDTKDAIKNAIQSKGVAVPAGTPFRDYANKVAAISGGDPAPVVPVPSLASMKTWESAFSNNADSYTMDYSAADEGDTVITVLFYYKDSENLVTITPSGIMSVVGTSEGGTENTTCCVDVYEFEKAPESPLPFDISIAGSGRRQIGYFSIPNVIGHEVVVDLISTDPVEITTDDELNIPAQTNSRGFPVLRCVSLGWSLASGQTGIYRYTNIPPHGFSGLLNTFNDRGGSSNHCRSVTFATPLQPGETAQHTLMPYTTAGASNINGLACVTYDIYYAPTP